MSRWDSMRLFFHRLFTCNCGGENRPAIRSKLSSGFYVSAKNRTSSGLQVILGREAEDLYQEVLYGVLHGLGNCSQDDDQVENRFSCLRHVFRYSREKHLELLDRVNQIPPPEVALQVVVVEGRNLRGKGANGSRNPVCSVWLAGCQHLQQNTAVKPGDLDPVWNEQFEFPVRNDQDDTLHVEVWDFDVDETVVKKSSRVKIRGWKRFGKLLKKSDGSTTGSGKAARKLLGLFSVPVKDVPVLGMERWFTLEARQKKQLKNCGEIKLQLSFTTKNTELPRNFQQSLEDYEKVAKIVVGSELRDNPDWSGTLGELQSNLLLSFAAQRGLNPPVTDLLYLCVLIKGLQLKKLDCHLSWNILERSRKNLKDGTIPEEVEPMFWKAADSFVNTTMAVVRSLAYNTSFSNNPEQLRSLLMCLVEIRKMDDNKGGGTFSHLDVSIYEALTEEAYEALTEEAADSEDPQEGNLGYHLLWKILERSSKYLEDESNPGEVELMFWKAAESFINKSMTTVGHLSNNNSFSENPEQLRALLMCLKEIKRLDELKNGGEFPNLELPIPKAVTLGAADLFDQVAGEGTATVNDDPVVSCIQICQKAMSGLKQALTVYNEIFTSTLQIPYFSLLYEYYDSQLASTCSAAVDNAIESLKPMDFDENTLYLAALEASGESPGPDAMTSGIQETAGKSLDSTVTMGTALFQLYLSLQQFQKFSVNLSEEENEHLRVRNFHAWFSTIVGGWLSITLYKALISIGKAVSIDTFVPVDGLVKHSTSAVDALTVVYQMTVSWKQLAWPHTEESLTFATKAMEDICRCCNFYTDVVDRQLQKMISSQETKFTVTQQILCIVNDVLHVRQSIRPTAEALEISNLFLSLQQPATLIETVLNSAEKNIDSRLDEMYRSIARRIAASVAKFLPNDLESTSSSAQLADLIRYLDDNLTDLKSQLESLILNKIVRIIGERVMQTILNAINTDIDKKRPPAYFKHWDHVLEPVTGIFYAEQDTEDEVLGNIRRLLKIHSSETAYLIHQYCLERLRLTTDEDEYGQLSIRALFVNENLIVEVLNARNLKATSRRGSCNPYVKMELVLTEKCADIVHKTKVRKNTLFPLFDQTFTFKVSLNMQLNPECFILFRLKDHDSLVSGEFVAETHLEFQNIQRGFNISELHEQQQIHLTFSKNTIKESEHLQILANRTSDKIAKEFIKYEKKRTGDKIKKKKKKTKTAK